VNVFIYETGLRRPALQMLNMFIIRIRSTVRDVKG